MCVNVAVVLAVPACEGNDVPNKDVSDHGDLFGMIKGLEIVAGLVSANCEGVDWEGHDFEPVKDGDNEEDACAVVQLIRLPREIENEGELLAAITGRLRDVRYYGRALSDHTWKHLDRDLAVLNTPSCSGVLIEGSDGKQQILTAAHCDRILTEDTTFYAIAGRTVDADGVGGAYPLYPVTVVSRFLCSGPPCNTWGETIDLMVLEFKGPIQGACSLKIAGAYDFTAEPVFAQFHPLGLAQVRSTSMEVDACGKYACTAKFDNGEGGSGGVIVNKNNEIVGIVSGDVDIGASDGKTYSFPSDLLQPFTRASMLSDYSGKHIGAPRFLHLE